MASQFRGWYFKCQSKEHTLALIPAIHQGPKGRECSFQLISPENSQTVSLPSQGATLRWDRLEGQMNGFSFSPKGLTLHISTSETRLRGQLSFGPPASLSQDIMGPFRYVPFLECRHRVYSMAHSVEGRLEWNGRIFSFSPGRGYIEGDQGRSFPKRYVWSQCLFPQGSLMLSVASIPLGPFSFTGVLALVRFLGQEYRLATYLGARAEKNPAGGDPHPAGAPHAPGQPALFRSSGAVCSRSGQNVPPDPGKHHRPCPLCASQW